jgi:glycosyltransferase involved in cell wall biosynthesis
MENRIDKKTDFVVIGSEESCVVNDFGYRPIIFAKALSRSTEVGKVCIVNCPVSFPRRAADSFFMKKRVEDIYPVCARRLTATAFKIDDKTYMINLTSIFSGSRYGASNVDSCLHAESISAILRTIGFNDYILWTASPRVIDIAARIRPGLLIFDAIDDMLSHPQMSRYYGQIKKAYGWVENNADIICIASEGQRKMFPRSSKLLLMSNGVDIGFIKKTTSLIPPDIKYTTGPVIGYVGVLQDRFDVALVDGLARILSSYSIILVGPVRDRAYFEPLNRRSNVSFLGKKRYSDIPDYIKCFDVCIIPHKVNEFTGSMDPLKIYEYLSCGKPIVSTPVSGTERFKGYIITALDAAGFADAIKTAIATDNINVSAERRVFASHYSWDNNITSLMKTINAMSEGGR